MKPPCLGDDRGEGEGGGDDENDEIAGLSDEYLRALIFRCLANGMTDSPGMVASIWGIAKSGKSARYAKALDRLRAVRQKYKL